jgi:hypothetical protein
MPVISRSRIKKLVFLMEAHYVVCEVQVDDMYNLDEIMN